MAPKVTEPKREAWIDFVKAAAIFLIVLGHASGLPDALRGVIYSFHVPAFLLVTGYLLPPQFAAWHGGFPKRQIGAFLRLYLFFSFLSMLLLALKLLLSGEALAPILADSAQGVLYGVSGREKAFVHQNAPLWYFPFLISSLIAAWIAAALGRRLSAPIAGLALLLAGCLAAMHLREQVWPWYANSAAVGGLFIWTGWSLRPALRRVADALNGRAAPCSALALGLSAATVALYALNGRVNINGGMFGESIWLFFITAFAGTLALAAWGLLLPPLKIIRLLSANTLVIFCTHIYLIHLTNLIPFETMGLLIRMAVVMLCAVQVTAICTLLSMRITPWLVSRVMRKSDFPTSRAFSRR